MKTKTEKKVWKQKQKMKIENKNKNIKNENEIDFFFCVFTFLFTNKVFVYKQIVCLQTNFVYKQTFVYKHWAWFLFERSGLPY